MNFLNKLLATHSLALASTSVLTKLPTHVFSTMAGLLCCHLYVWSAEDGREGERSRETLTLSSCHCVSKDSEQRTARCWAPILWKSNYFLPKDAIWGSPLTCPLHHHHQEVEAPLNVKWRLWCGSLYHVPSRPSSFVPALVYALTPLEARCTERLHTFWHLPTEEVKKGGVWDSQTWNSV